MSMQQSLEAFSEKKEIRVELKPVGNVVAKTVLVERVNRISLEEVCRTQYSLKYFSKPYRPSDRLEKTLKRNNRVTRWIFTDSFGTTRVTVRCIKRFPRFFLKFPFLPISLSRLKPMGLWVSLDSSASAYGELYMDDGESIGKKIKLFLL